MIHNLHTTFREKFKRDMSGNDEKTRAAFEKYWHEHAGRGGGKETVTDLLWSNQAFQGRGTLSRPTSGTVYSHLRLLAL